MKLKLTINTVGFYEIKSIENKITEEILKNEQKYFEEYLAKFFNDYNLAFSVKIEEVS